MYDESGIRRIELMEAGDVSTLRFFDAAGVPLVELRQAAADAQVSLGASADGKPPLQLVSGYGKNGVHLSGSKPNGSLSLETNLNEEPQLAFTGGATNGQYRSGGMCVSSQAGGLSFYLTPGKRAALSLSACPLVAGEEGVEIATSPSFASLKLKSLDQGSDASIFVNREVASFGLKPSRKEAIAQWTIRDHGGAADSSLLMRSDRGQESIQIDLNETGPQMQLFNSKGQSLLNKPALPPPNNRP